MSFDWEQYLMVAKHLKDNATNPNLSEGMCRSSASRAYYSAYHYALDVALRLGFTDINIPKGQLHHELIEFYKGRSELDLKKIGADLGRLKENRIESDYHLSLSEVPILKASYSLRIAENIILWAKTNYPAP